ncbi:hypothetical protein MUK42_10862 [Musa troglodytarum]|uniref:Uncharacterized protein n=1 Tax=Musa troglodytarum TaxID=320322 RepID=A0A9E7F978_9LILI|nr:hypothetical protein MUK42_10862 [Musa troglodytarum]
MRRLRLPRPRMRGVKISGSVILTKVMVIKYDTWKTCVSLHNQIVLQFLQVGSIHNTSWMLAFELQYVSTG